jgi:hypothetical protein
VAVATPYDRKAPITAAGLLNDRVAPLFDPHAIKRLRVLTNQGMEYCGRPEPYAYDLYLAVEDLDHSRYPYPGKQFWR